MPNDISLAASMYIGAKLAGSSEDLMSEMPLSWYWLRGLQRASTPPARLVRPMEKIQNSTNKTKKAMVLDNFWFAKLMRMLC